MMQPKKVNQKTCGNDERSEVYFFFFYGLEYVSKKMENLCERLCFRISMNINSEIVDMRSVWLSRLDTCKGPYKKYVTINLLAFFRPLVNIYFET